MPDSQVKGSMKKASPGKKHETEEERQERLAREYELSKIKKGESYYARNASGKFYYVDPKEKQEEKPPKPTGLRIINRVGSKK